MKNEIIDLLKEKLEQVSEGTYKVITAYNADQDIELSGVVAIQIQSIENLHHGNEQDYKYTVSVAGQTLADQDKDKTKIQAIYEKVFRVMCTRSNFDEIENLAGYLFNDAQIEDDGDTRKFQFNTEWYMCDVY